jgi:hypothetical protein
LGDFFHKLVKSLYFGGGIFEGKLAIRFSPVCAQNSVVKTFENRRLVIAGIAASYTVPVFVPAPGLICTELPYFGLARGFESVSETKSVQIAPNIC